MDYWSILCIFPLITSATNYYYYRLLPDEWDATRNTGLSSTSNKVNFGSVVGDQIFPPLPPSFRLTLLVPNSGPLLRSRVQDTWNGRMVTSKVLTLRIRYIVWLFWHLVFSLKTIIKLTKNQGLLVLYYVKFWSVPRNILFRISFEDLLLL